MKTEKLEEEKILVRSLRAKDLEPVIVLDAKITGRRREEYFQLKLKQALSDTGVMVSLAAEKEGQLLGFLLARVFYGEFGTLEQVAVLDTLGVHPAFRHLGIAAAILRQLRTNLLGLGIRRVQTEVGWDDQDLLSFFHHEGFRPAQRLCLEQELRYPTD